MTLRLPPSLSTFRTICFVLSLVDYNALRLFTWKYYLLWFVVVHEGLYEEGFTSFFFRVRLSHASLIYNLWAIMMIGWDSDNFRCWCFEYVFFMNLFFVHNPYLSRIIWISFGILYKGWIFVVYGMKLWNLILFIINLFYLTPSYLKQILY